MSAIVVAGGVSKRFGQEKCLAKLGGKPLILHVLNRLAQIVDEVVVVVSSNEQKLKIGRIVEKRVHIEIDNARFQTPLVGALTGFEAISRKNALLLACDTPFLSPEMLFFLWKSCKNKDGVVPRWPNGNIEPLHSAYNVAAAKRAAGLTLTDGKLDMRSFLAKMQRIQYIPITYLEKFDSELKTFYNINTHSEMQLAGEMVGDYEKNLNVQLYMQNLGVLPQTSVDLHFQREC
jgi:molybdopterin-guanine dinucleotide biosynthesis protein A